MVCGYLETSTVAGPFSKRSTRALVSASSWSSAHATPVPKRASAVTPRRNTPILLFIRIRDVLFRLESIGKLNDKQAGRQPVGIEAAVGKPFIIAFQQQRVREVINKTGCRAIGGRSQRVIRRVVAPDQFEVV